MVIEQKNQNGVGAGSLLSCFSNTFSMHWFNHVFEGFFKAFSSTSLWPEWNIFYHANQENTSVLCMNGTLVYFFFCPFGKLSFLRHGLLKMLNAIPTNKTPFLKRKKSATREQDYIGSKRCLEAKSYRRSLTENGRPQWLIWLHTI